MTDPAGKAVFLSYASQDADVAEQLADALRAAGVEVWFDRDELGGGDAWDAKIRRQIRECALFVPLVSASTQARLEGYFRLEWKLAEDRSHLIAKGKPFLLPLAFDGVTDRDAAVPDAFLAVQWVKLGRAGPFDAAVGAVTRALSGSSSLLSRSRASGQPAGDADPASPPRVPDYELVKPIGRGAYGEVWLARGITGAWRAVKVVWRDRFPDAEPFEREFRGVKEAMALPAAETGTLALHHVGRDERDRFFYYVMELADDAVHGRDVDPARYEPLTLKQLRHTRPRLPAAAAAELGLELARGLAALHRRGLVHRDIKPSNIVYVSGRPRLADVGLVAPSGNARTFVGTEGFVPPEGPGTPAADVYALGRVLYEAATGLDRGEYPRLPDTFTGPDERRAFFRLNPVLLRAGDPEAGRRYRDAAALLADLESAAGSAPVRTARRLPWVLAGLGAAAAAIAAWTFLARPPASPPASVPPAAAPLAETRLAVLPFTLVGAEGREDNFSDGFTLEIQDLLSRQPGLSVIGSGSTFALKGRNLPAAEVARTLGVGRLVEGSVQRAGDRVRVRVQLVRAADGVSESVGSFEQPMAALFALQDEVARAVLARVAAGRTPATARVLTRQPAAYEAYLEGRALRSRSALFAPQAAGLFERAVKLDPDFAEAWAELAGAQFRATAIAPARRAELVAATRAALERALALRPDLPEALLVRANLRRGEDGDLAGAAADLARAEAQPPVTVSLRTAQASLARARGDWAEQRRRLDQALALDPCHGDYLNAAALEYAKRGLYAEADALLARAELYQGTPVPFNNRIPLRSRWRGPEAAARLLASAPAPHPSHFGLHLRNLIERGRTAEARELAVKREAEADALAQAGKNDEAARLRLSSEQLHSVGLPDLARRRGLEQLPRLRARYDQGERGAALLAPLLRFELRYGNRAIVAARLDEWRAGLGQHPDQSRRRTEFAEPAARLYALLGDADRALGLLEELAAQSYYSLLDPDTPGDWDLIRNDPRFRALEARERARAAAEPDPADDPLATAAALPALSALPAPATPAPAPGEKTLVVLPLSVPGNDADAALLADGLHEDMISHLSTLPDLAVRSRVTSLTFKDKSLALAEIGRQAPATFALTGSVRRLGDALRIQLNLRRTADEAQIWQKDYTFDLKAGFPLYEELLSEVGRVLQAREVKGSWAGAQFMTKNAEAYQIFLKARVLHVSQRVGLDTFLEQVRLCHEALKLDPNFMPAANLLSISYSYAHSSRDLTSPQRKEYADAAKHWAEVSAKLVPGGAGDGALSVYYSMVERDPARAFAYALNEVRASPNDANGYNRIAIGYANQGRIAESLAAHRRMLELDPNHPRGLHSFTGILATFRRVDEFEAIKARTHAVYGSSLPTDNYAFATYNLTGRMPEDLEKLPPRLRFYFLSERRDFAAARALADSELGKPDLTLASRLNWIIERGLLCAYLKDTAGQAAAAAEAASLLPQHQPPPEKDQSRHDELVLWAHALGGRPEAALQTARRLVEAVPESGFTVRERREREVVMAELQAFLGQRAECLALLRRLLLVPSGLTVTLLERSPRWDNVRDDPAFAALLADPRHRAPFGDPAP